MRAQTVMRFLIVGGGAAVVELGLFQLLVLIHVDPVPANIASFVVGLVTSFVGYRLWSFVGDHTLPVAGQFGAYLTLALANAAVSSLAIHALVAAGMIPLLAKAGSMGVIAAWNYVILNRLVFRRGVRARVGAADTTAVGAQARDASA